MYKNKGDTLTVTLLMPIKFLLVITMTLLVKFSIYVRFAY